MSVHYGLVNTNSDVFPHTNNILVTHQFTYPLKITAKMATLYILLTSCLQMMMFFNLVSPQHLELPTTEVFREFFKKNCT